MTEREKACRAGNAARHDRGLMPVKLQKPTLKRAPNQRGML